MVMGMADRPPTPDELAQMIALLEDALDAGALGLSSGLFTAPGSYAQPDEMIALCRVVKRYNAGYFTHIRDEVEQGAGRGRGSDRDCRDVRRARRDRALQVLGNGQLGQGRARTRHDRGGQGARARRRLRFLSLCRRQQPAQEPDAAMGAGGRRRGHAGTACGRSRRAIASARTLPATASTIGVASRRGIACRSRSRPTCRSMPDARSARSRHERGQDPIDTVADYLIEDKGATRVLVTSISEDDIRAIVRSPLALVGSDGNCVATYGTVSQGMPHPALLRHVPAHHRPLRRRARPDPAGAGGSQDDRRDRACAETERSRPARGRLLRRRRRSSIPPTSGIAPPTPIRTNIRPARAPP